MPAHLTVSQNLLKPAIGKFDSCFHNHYLRAGLTRSSQALVCNEQACSGETRRTARFLSQFRLPSSGFRLPGSGFPVPGS